MKRVMLILVLLLTISCVKQNIQTEEDIEKDLGNNVIDETDEVQEISYSLFEWGIEPKNAELKSGKIKFIVSNDGSDFHTFKIEGNGIEKEIGILKGEVEILELGLKKGKYSIYCSIPGHSYKGMEAELIIDNI